jgi:mono/diheme cytochrome c family protein
MIDTGGNAKMKKALKWIGIVLGGLVGLLILLAIGLVIYGQISFKRTYADRPLYPITADTSPEGVARGKYLMEGVMICYEACHSEFGKPFAGGYEEVNDGPISAVFAVPNITQDMETGLGGWSDAEIARAIREGIDKDGVSLMIMPASSYHALSDADVAAVVGYLRGLEPVRNEVPPFQVNTVAKVMNALGMFGPSQVSEPFSAPQVAPQPGTVEYGAYLVSLGDCRGCHGPDLAGGPMPFASEGPLPANLTPAGELPGWTEADFIAAVSTGQHPSGTVLTDGMPRYPMTDEDLAAIFMYLQTLPPVTPES